MIRASLVFITGALLSLAGFGAMVWLGVRLIIEGSIAGGVITLLFSEVGAVVGLPFLIWASMIARDKVDIVVDHDDIEAAFEEAWGRKAGGWSGR